MSILNESTRYLDFKNVMIPVVSIDEYEARMGKDSDIVTLTFIVKSKQSGEDLSGWFERGYEYVLDAKVSDGEISPNRYLVFVEMYRRRAVPERIIEMLSDLETLTGYDISDWTVKINDVEYDAELVQLKDKIITSPIEYREKKDNKEEEQLNEYRHRAGLPLKTIYSNSDPDIITVKTIAGL